MKLIVATNNEHKLSEIRSMLDGKTEVLSLKDIGFCGDIEENGSTLAENSHIKAAAVATYLDSINYDAPYAVIADDTGLMADALGGEPGVRTARYAGGDGSDSEANIRLLLKNLDGKENRKARFCTVITMIEKNAAFTTNIKYFTGTAEGTILAEKRGEGGFGYDPIFMPDGYDKSFAELGDSVKNKISHRAKAVSEMTGYINSL